jgi:hypothetical protein
VYTAWSKKSEKPFDINDCALARIGLYEGPTRGTDLSSTSDFFIISYSVCPMGNVGQAFDSGMAYTTDKPLARYLLGFLRSTRNIPYPVHEFCINNTRSDFKWIQVKEFMKTLDQSENLHKFGWSSVKKVAPNKIWAQSANCKLS